MGKSEEYDVATSQIGCYVRGRQDIGQNLNFILIDRKVLYGQ